MSQDREFSCSDCSALNCEYDEPNKYPKYCLTENMDPELLNEAFTIYKEDEEQGKIARVSASIESDFYQKYCRVEETIEFIKRMDYKKVGIATCIGLINETKIFTKILKKYGIDYVTAVCKIGAIDKEEIGIPAERKLNGGAGHESICNPVLQAKFLDSQNTDLNIIVGLCVGHDSLFIKNSKAPVTVMIVKDRVLGHNPAVALYTANSYSRFDK